MTEPAESGDKKGETVKLGNLASYLLNRIAHRYNHGTHSRLKAVGLTTIATRIIVSLKVYGELTVKELCVHAIAEQPTMSRALDRMEDEKLISRQVSDKDNRVRVVRLTEQGEAVYEKIWPVMVGANEDLLRGISEDDRAALMRILTTILENIRKNPF